jgi:hypothetical protein
LLVLPLLPAATTTITPFCLAFLIAELVEEFFGPPMDMFMTHLPPWFTAWFVHQLIPAIIAEDNPLPPQAKTLTAQI